MRNPSGKRWITILPVIILISVLLIFLFIIHSGVTRVSLLSANEVGPYLNVQFQFSQVPDLNVLKEHIVIEPVTDFNLSREGQVILLTTIKPQPYGQELHIEIKPFRDTSNHLRFPKAFVISLEIRQPAVAVISADKNSLLRITGTGESEILYESNNITELAVSYSGLWISWVEEEAHSQSQLFIARADGIGATLKAICNDGFCANPVPSPAAIEEGFLYTVYHPEINQTEIHHWIGSTDSDTLLITVDNRIEEPLLWSPDGKQIAWYSSADQAVIVFSMENHKTYRYPKEDVSLGAWSQDGKFIFIRHTHQDLTNTYSHLCHLNLFAGEYQPLENPYLLEGQYSSPYLIPGENVLVFARQSLIRENTKQIWQYDMDTNTVQQITDEPKYNHARYSFDLSGRYLVFQRLDVTRSDAIPEVWIWDRETLEFRQLTAGAVLPVWLP